MESNKNNVDDKVDSKSLDDSIAGKNKPKRIIKKKKAEEYSEDTVNITLYYEVSSTIYNSLANLVVRKAIMSDENLIKILELQISNLFFLEIELVQQLNNKKYAIEFLQIISNLMDRSFSVTKSSRKNRIEILEERNLLIVSITNSCKTIERESLERIRQFDNETLVQLNDQIAALNNFSDDNISPTVSVSNPMSGNQLNNSMPNINNLDNASLANLAKLGVLPQHPATNPKFYPYVSKPKSIPLLKKILCGFLLLTVLLLTITYIMTYFVTSNFVIKAGGSAVDYNFGQKSQSVIFSIITTLLFGGGFVYYILKPAKLIRDTYRISYFLLIMVIFWIIYSVANIVLMTTDNSLTATFASFLADKTNSIDSNALSWLKSLSTFQAFKILTYVSAVSAVPSVVIGLVIAILNPKRDNNKIIRANSEYQNAINSALNGKSYEIDPSLFDDNDDNDKKIKTGHKFWKDSDLFK
ncbi:hypothetical protein [Spiroplasma endosymbiont of Virgichneumon dumeticola]|uniref:hypothetical protein n=1 Tax=Spiroplasma endosymbiont of Virgichneumon dumeticola TaxID=3139323 RepID=UPI0035C8EF0B